MKNLILSCFLLLSALNSYSQVFKVDTIFFSGNSEQHINIAILPDGYQASEMGKFRIDAQNFANGFFMVPPFKNYSSYFNLFTVNVPSNESGADHPGTATDVNEPDHPLSDVDNYFGSTFDYFEIHRLLVPLEEGRIFNVLANNLPLYDQVIILVNTPYYGGSGGTYATASLHQQSIEVTIHELGHSFGGLSDEYYAGDFYAGENVNMTKESDPEKVRWKNWVGHDEVGAYQHCCSGNSTQWYRPHQSCKMRVLGAPFCPVCSQAIIEHIHSLVSPIQTFSPVNTTLTNEHQTIDFSVGAIKPEPNTLKYMWELNGENTIVTAETYTLAESDLVSGMNILAVYVEDTTDLLRVDAHDQVHLYSVVWTIENNSLSTDQITGKEEKVVIDIFPNPAVDKLNIAVKKGFSNTTLLSIEMIDVNGKTVRMASFMSNEVELVDLKNLEPGIYGISIYSGKIKVGAKKIVVK